MEKQRPKDISRKNLLSTFLSFFIILIDILMVLAGFYLAVIIRMVPLSSSLNLFDYTSSWFKQSIFPPDLNFALMLSVYLVVVTFLTFKYFNLYYEKGIYRSYSDFWRIARAITVLLIFTMVLLFVFKVIDFSRMVIIYFWFLSILFVAVGRVVFDFARRWVRTRFGIDKYRCVVVGNSDFARQLGLQLTPASGFKHLGFVKVEEDGNAKSDSDRKGQADLHFLGSSEDLEQVVSENDVSAVFLVDDGLDYNRMMELVVKSTNMGLETRVISKRFETFIDKIPAPVEVIMDVAMLRFRVAKFQRWRKFVKRVFDVVISVVVLVVGLPVWVIVALLIKLESPGPVIFKQKRITKDGKIFTCYKFRSMYADAEQKLKEVLRYNEKQPQIFKMRDDPRITKVGSFIRRMSIDEIPQLINVLKGDISLVGPRTPIPQEVVKYKPWHKVRLRDKTGITGLWQVSGRSELDFDEMVILDIYYLLNRSLSLDFRIMVKTIFVVLFAKGAY